MTKIKSAFINMILVILVWITVITKVEAEQCMEGQHCASCASDGNCIKCDKGYYGSKCNNTCSPGCRRNSCDMKNKCTFGCKHGFYGKRCLKPCKTHTDKCRKCPQKCDRGICQFGWSCAKGCQDSYYGTSCKSCPAWCEVCDRVSGTCKDCRRCTGNCTHRCLGGCQPGACLECKSGWFGSTCKNRCPKTCADKQCDKNGICNLGCKKSWYGPSCESSCGTGCDGRLCNRTGTCSDGCRKGLYGKHCQKKCPTYCLNKVCDVKNGSCKSCEKGFYGSHCNKLCGRCVAGSCTGNCTIDDCREACKHESEAASLYWIAGASLIFIIFLVVVLYVTFHFKRINNNMYKCNGQAQNRTRDVELEDIGTRNTLTSLHTVTGQSGCSQEGVQVVVLNQADAETLVSVDDDVIIDKRVLNRDLLRKTIAEEVSSSDSYMARKLEVAEGNDELKRNCSALHEGEEETKMIVEEGSECEDFVDGGKMKKDVHEQDAVFGCINLSKGQGNMKNISKNEAECKMKVADRSVLRVIEEEDGLNGDC